MAALNLQTPDLPNQLNSTLFKNNGNSGYVLKPESMTKLNNKFDPFEVDRSENAMTLTINIRIISGQLFCLLSDKTPLSIYVEVDLYGLPKDTHKCIYRTSTQTIDGLNTVFSEQKPVFSTYGGWQITDFPCRLTIEKIFFPELAFLRFAVYEESKSDLLGQVILQVKNLQPGHKHLILTNEFNKPIGPVSLFVYFDVKNFKETSKNKNRPKIEVLSKEGVKYWHFKLKQSMSGPDNK
uniref:phosphoinositide phospholipase C n=1 Tax=Ditylenchus dipsaci TaxID=166011 RepID=A0A915CRC3_9BILA